MAKPTKTMARRIKFDQPLEQRMVLRDPAGPYYGVTRNRLVVAAFSMTGRAGLMLALKVRFIDVM